MRNANVFLLEAGLVAGLPNVVWNKDTYSVYIGKVNDH